MKITDEVLTGYLNCKYKAYLILRGVAHEWSAYEHWLHKREEQYADDATRALLGRENSCVIATNLPETDQHLKQGINIVIGAQAESEPFAFSFHALQRVHGSSALGPFHYVPVLFSTTGASVSDAQKLVLSCESLILERLQQVRLPTGILVSLQDSHRRSRTANVGYIQDELPACNLPDAERSHIDQTCRDYDGAIYDVRKEIRNLEDKLGMHPGEPPFDPDIMNPDPRVTMGFISNWLWAEIKAMHQTILRLEEATGEASGFSPTRVGLGAE